MKQLQFLKFGLMLCVLCSYCIAQAQKLPKTQNNSLRIPDGVKIDGKATELNNTFQAYNPATSLYYTLSNDDENLYLAIQTSQPRVMAKMLYSGVTLVVNTIGRKKDNDAGNMMITYPNLTADDSQYIVSKLGIKIATGRNIIKKGDPPKLTDSAIAVVNHLIEAKANIIKISGIKAIDDSLLSIYNAGGIKVASTTNQQVYTYEMLVPLKLLGLSVNSAKSFSYEVKLLNRLETGKKFPTVYGFAGGAANDINPDLDATTNFWGEYTLAKTSNNHK